MIVSFSSGYALTLTLYIKMVSFSIALRCPLYHTLHFQMQLGLYLDFLLFVIDLRIRVSMPSSYYTGFIIFY